MTRELRKPKVLAISEDQLFIKSIRVEMPLLSLVKQGLIDDYHIADPSLRDVPGHLKFDIIWLSRVANNRLIDAIVKTVSDRFIYDTDDLFLVVPSYRTEALGQRDPVIKALEKCAVLCTPSMRLCRLLERHSNLALSHKAVVCKHGFEFSRQIRKPKKPAGILWTSSDYIALTRSREDVLKAVGAFAHKYDLPVYFFGMLSDDIKLQIPRIVHMGFVPYWQYKVALSSSPPLLGVAPLETKGDGETQDYINGKSDVKMVDFGGLGHPSIYSATLPYLESDLKIGTIVENTEGDWRNALEEVFRSSWKKLGSEQERIVELRHIDKIASEAWYKAISRVRLPQPISIKEIRF